MLNALEYQRALLAAEPWRLLTAHIAHINWMHASINAATWWVLARLFAPDLSAPRQLIALAASSLAISVGLATLYPQMAWYRGASASLHALFFCGASKWLATTLMQTQTRTLQALWLPALLLVGGIVKVAAEHPQAGALPFADWLGANTAPQSHTLGAVTGLLIGGFYAWRDERNTRRA